MPHIISKGSQFLLRPERESFLHLEEFASKLGQLSSSEEYADVIVHCKGRTMVKANKVILSQSSKLLRSVFETNSFQPITFDLLCPDFSPESVQKLIQILNKGRAIVESKELLHELKFLFCCLLIEIPLEQQMLSEVATPEKPANLPFRNDSCKSPNMPFRCHYCDKTFLLEVALDQHTTKHFSRTSASSDQSINEDESSSSIKTAISPSTGIKIENSEIEKDELTSFEKDSGSTDIADDIANESNSIDDFKKLNNVQSIEKHFEDVILQLQTNQAQPVSKNEMKGNANLESLNDAIISETQSEKIMTQIFDEIEPVRKFNATMKENSDTQAQTDKNNLREKRMADKILEEDEPRRKILKLNSTEDENFVVGSELYKCHLCSDKLKSYKSLLSHFAQTHFRDELKQFNGSEGSFDDGRESDEGECRICKNVLLNEEHLLEHLAVAHSALDKFIPSKTNLLVLKNRQRKAYTTKYNKEKSSTVDENKKSKNQAKTNLFECHLCDLRTGNHADVMRHMGLRHYKPEVAAFFGSQKGSCGVCQRHFNTADGLIRHIVGIHKVIDKFVPSKKCLSIKV